MLLRVEDEDDDEDDDDVEGAEDVDGSDGCESGSIEVEVLRRRVLLLRWHLVRCHTSSEERSYSSA